MNVILCGYHWSGCDALRQLHEDGHNVFVYTHESPFFVPSLVEYCRRTETPFTTRSVNSEPLPFEPDVIASVYYRKMIKPHVIAASKGRIFNLHPSLLPAYRGCSSLTWAMIEGCEEAGFTYHYIDNGCDTGNVIVQKRVPILAFDTQATLFQRVAFESMRMFRLALSQVVLGVEGRPQVGRATYFPRGCPYGGEIQPEWSIEFIERFIRAMIHPPYPPATYRGLQIFNLEDYKSAIAVQ